MSGLLYINGQPLLAHVTVKRNLNFPVVDDFRDLGSVNLTQLLTQSTRLGKEGRDKNEVPVFIYRNRRECAPSETLD